MPLSDREQQILSEMEAQLRADDPKLARTVETTTISSRVRARVRVAAIGLVLGFIVLLAMVPVGNVLVGVAGFAIMLAAVLLGGQAFTSLGSEDNDDLGSALRGGFQRYMDERRTDDADSA